MNIRGTFSFSHPLAEQDKNREVHHGNGSEEESQHGNGSGEESQHGKGSGEESQYGKGLEEESQHGKGSGEESQCGKGSGEESQYGKGSGEKHTKSRGRERRASVQGRKAHVFIVEARCHFCHKSGATLENVAVNASILSELGR
jgi:hypothetical protein